MSPLPPIVSDRSLIRFRRVRPSVSVSERHWDSPESTAGKLFINIITRPRVPVGNHDDATPLRFQLFAERQWISVYLSAPRFRSCVVTSPTLCAVRAYSTQTLLATSRRTPSVFDNRFCVFARESGFCFGPTDFYTAWASSHMCFPRPTRAHADNKWPPITSVIIVIYTDA